MSDAHRWVVLTTIAVPEQTPEQLAIGVVASLSWPHTVSGPLCFDCGVSADSDYQSDCPAQPRAGYPE